MDSLLRDHNGHLSVLPVAIYKLLVALFGLDSQLPFRLVLSLSVVAVGVLVYALVSERAGRAAGLVAARCCCSSDRRGTTCCGRSRSASSARSRRPRHAARPRARHAAAQRGRVLSARPLAIPLRPRRPLHRLGRDRGRAARRAAQAWIPLVPLALFALWYVTYGRTHRAPFRPPSALRPGLRVRLSGERVASLSGFARDVVRRHDCLCLPLLASRSPDPPLDRSRRAPPSRVFIFLGGALAFWILAGANYITGRAGVGRYQLVHVYVPAPDRRRAVRVDPAGLSRRRSRLRVRLPRTRSNLSALPPGTASCTSCGQRPRRPRRARDHPRPPRRPGFRLSTQCAARSSPTCPPAPTSP